MKYYNILKNNELVLSDDKKYTNDEIKQFLLDMLIDSKINILEFKEMGNSYYYLKFKDNDKILNLYFLIKNITGGGWKDKPKIRRIQVPNIMNTNPEFVIHNDKNSINLIIGFYNYDNNPIFVGWDAYRYYNHNTLRSCYVSVDSLKRGYIKGFYDGIVSSQKIWIFTSSKFISFLNDYIIYIDKEWSKK